jgi:aspartyl-tRNA(Asn)/glutamyl-tRNA(Gln) amidotransferase subunit A
VSEEFTWMPGWQIRDLVAKRDVSCLEVVDHFLGRIEELNGTLRAFE